jgi:hypothetical protein
MDNAVSLVQAYLRLNGYLTVTEFPVLVEGGRDGVRTVTDLDVLAFRFPGAGPPGVGAAGRARETALDPALGADPAHADMIIGEVKEGRAHLNASALDQEVIEAALVRFGCCTPAAAPEQVRTLVHAGATRLESRPPPPVGGLRSNPGCGRRARSRDRHRARRALPAGVSAHALELAPTRRIQGSRLRLPDHAGEGAPGPGAGEAPSAGGRVGDPWDTT